VVAIESIIGHFNNKELLIEALTHSSATAELGNHFGLPCNERLEFLGDAVLQLVVTEQLLKDNTPSDEGELSQRRAALVSGAHLASICQNMDLVKYLRAGKGALREGIMASKSAQSDLIEAIIGAIYLDQGVAAAKTFIINHIYNSTPILKDYKSKLQEFTQYFDGGLPEYTLLSETGPDHQKSFQIRVSWNNNWAIGCGATKKAASASAAKLLLERLTKSV